MQLVRVISSTIKCNLCESSAAPSIVINVNHQQQQGCQSLALITARITYQQHTSSAKRDIKQISRETLDCFAAPLADRPQRRATFVLQPDEEYRSPFSFGSAPLHHKPTATHCAQYSGAPLCHTKHVIVARDCRPLQLVLLCSCSEFGQFVWLCAL